MSILSVMPCADWYYQPADLEDEEEDVPPPAIPFDLLTVSRGVVWFTAAPIAEEDE